MATGARWPLVATDGGAEQGTWPHEAAAFGIAVGTLDVGGIVPGLDSSSRAAEHHAANIALEAARLASVCVHLLIDNLSVGNALRGIMHSQTLLRHAVSQPRALQGHES